MTYRYVVSEEGVLLSRSPYVFAVWTAACVATPALAFGGLTGEVSANLRAVCAGAAVASALAFALSTLGLAWMPRRIFADRAQRILYWGRRAYRAEDIGSLTMEIGRGGPSGAKDVELTLVTRSERRTAWAGTAPGGQSGAHDALAAALRAALGL